MRLCGALRDDSALSSTAHLEETCAAPEASLELPDNDREEIMSANPENHFCLSPEPPEAQGQARAAILKKYVWPRGATIKIKFLEGDPALQSKVAAVAKEWTGPDMANMVFDFVDSDDADIRIAFAQGGGSWSYIGTDCQSIDPPAPTMNYGWLTADSTDDEIRRVVLHEFGHAIGLIHEHQNPNHPIQWNKDAVEHDLEGPPNNWSPEKIQANMFAKYEPGEVEATQVDKDSIMMYPIPKSWTLDGFSAGLNSKLTAQDEELVRAVYHWATS
jgi:serralysin